LLFPKDKKAGGSWIATSNDDRLVCLLNGAFERHKRQLAPYRKSRGLMVLDFFEHTSASYFFENYLFENMEPFTLVIYDKNKLYDFRWDGKEKHIKKLDSRGKYIWSAATLYPKYVREKREVWFQEWLSGKPAFTKKSLLDFHLHTGDGNPFYDLVMNRNGIVQTVSVSSVVKIENKINFQYLELLTNGKLQAELRLDNKATG